VLLRGLQSYNHLAGTAALNSIDAISRRVMLTVLFCNCRLL
jgi:hypothetical protein